MNGTPPLIAGSLFSGHGQLDFGLHLAGIEHAFFCESDPWRRGILEKRWPGVPVFDDVRAVDGTAPRVDLLVGGFPCRGASGAGKEEGMDHPETALWREMARIARDLRPRLLLLENVANLLAVRGGRTWGEVVGSMAQIGYVFGWDCLPAAAFGAPHLRDRVFCVAALADAETRSEGRNPEDVEARLAAELRGGAAADAGLPGWQERDGTESGEPQLAAADPRAAADADRHALRQQPEPERGSEGAAEPGIAPCGCLWEWIDHGGFCACCHAHLDDPRGLYAEQGDGSHRFAHCPSADPSRLRQGGPEAQAGAERQRAGGGAAEGHDWGRYAGAIQRWEEVAGPAPEPLVRGLDARDARRLVRSQLSAYGDGVHLGPAVFLGRRLLELWTELMSHQHRQNSTTGAKSQTKEAASAAPEGAER